MKRYYIQIGVVVQEGYDEAETYDEIRDLAMKYRDDMEKKHGHLGSLWFDIEEMESEDEI
jgi:hypothetical protein